MTREEASNKIMNYCLYLCGNEINAFGCNSKECEIGIAIESLQEPERKRGEWKIDGIAIVCDLCGAEIVLEQGDVDMNYCPQCGADMRGEQE